MGRVCLINGSPKGKLSSSLVFLRGLECRLTKKGAQTDLITVGHRSGEPTPETVLHDLADAEALIFSFPLYYYSTPAALTKLLEELSLYLGQHPSAERPARVYALVNSGYAGPEINEEALRIMRLFCRKTGLSWRFGAAIGAGAVVAMTSSFPPACWTVRRLYRRIVSDLQNESPGPAKDMWIRPIIPRSIMVRVKDSNWARKYMARQPKPEY